MRVTSEDKTNVNPAAAETAEKPKRGRKRKTPETEQVAGQATQPVAANQPAADMQPSASAHAADIAMPAAEANVPETAQESAASVAINYGSGCGNVLKAAREAQGLSIHEVCGQLRLGLKQIQAIEQDDFERLPQPSIVRGFIRNYARLLNIDVHPILEAYQRIVPNKEPLPLSVRSNASRSVIDKPARTFRPQRLLTFLIFLVLTGIAAYFYINHIKPHTLKDAALALDMGEISNTTEQEIALPAPEVAVVPTPAPATPENVDAAATATTGDTAQPASGLTTAPATPVLANTVTDNTVVSTPTPATTQAADSTTLKATDPQKANLMFKVTEDSWVRIEDMQGKKIFSEVLPAGSERQVTTDKPVNITVGHAGGTQLTIDNQPYDLTQATHGRVARIQLK